MGRYGFHDHPHHHIKQGLCWGKLPRLHKDATHGPDLTGMKRMGSKGPIIDKGNHKKHLQMNDLIENLVGG